MILEGEDQDVASLNQRGQDARVHELEQQLEIAESRCGTLKQQLDYMRNLYQGTHAKHSLEQKPNNDSIKRKSKGKHKSRRFNIETSPDIKCSDTSLIKINKLSKTPSSSSKNSPRLNKGDKIYTLKPGTNMPDMTNYRMLGPCGESPENVDYEFPIKDINLQTRPLSAQSTPTSPHSTSPVINSRPVSTHGTIMQNSLEMSQDMQNDDRDNKLESTSSAVQVIQDILCGITKSVNRISELNDFIHDSGREGLSENFPNTNYRNQIKQSGESQIRELNNDGQNNDQFSYNGCTENNTEELLGNVQTSRAISKKSHRSRGGKRDIPPKLLTTPYTTESIESVRGGKRKGKSHAKHIEKKSKVVGLPHLHTSKRTRITEDVISVTTKIRKKRNPKFWSFNSKSTNISQSNHQDISHKSNHNVIGDSPYSQVPIPYHIWRSDNVVELYHNASLHADTSASDDTFTRLSRPKSHEYSQKDEYLQKEIIQVKGQSKKSETYKMENDEEGYHISEDSGDEILNEDIMQNNIHPITSGVELKHTVENNFRGHNSVQSEENIDNTNISTGSQNNTKKITRNFQLPTVSSKLKQVDRNFFQRFNFHNIPFVAGTSTSPSHNLGLNIQQVLSIIKMRQPLGNYIPEVLNRNLFGSKQNQPLNTIPRESSHISQRTINPNEEFPEIPERDDTKDQENQYNQSYDYNKPCLSRPKTADPLCQEHNLAYDVHKSQKIDDQRIAEHRKFECRGTKSNVNCSCFPTRRSVNYQKILNQYLEDGEKLSFLKSSAPYQNYIPYKTQPLRQHCSTMSRMQHHLKIPTVMSVHSLKDGRMNELTAIDTENMLNMNNRDIKKKDPDFFVSIQGKAKSLKDVLTNLHDDFRRLNSKYEELQAGVTQDSVNEMETIKELDAMELELQTKEEEITVVMALYKEVLSLKEQVRALKERASSANFNQQPTRTKPHRLAPREPTAAVRLTRLLRTIQQFQDRLRHD